MYSSLAEEPHKRSGTSLGPVAPAHSDLVLSPHCSTNCDYNQYNHLADHGKSESPVCSPDISRSNGVIF